MKNTLMIILLFVSFQVYGQIKVDTFYVDGTGDSPAEFSKELASASTSKKKLIFHKSIGRREAAFLDTVKVSEIKARLKQVLDGDTLFPAYLPNYASASCKNVFPRKKYHCLGWTLYENMKKIISLNNSEQPFTIDLNLHGQLRWEAMTAKKPKFDGGMEEMNRLETFLFQRDVNHRYVAPKSIKNVGNRHYTLLFLISPNGVLHVETLIPTVLDDTDKTLFTALNKAVEAFPAWSFRYLYTSDGRCFPARIYDAVYLGKSGEWNLKNLIYDIDAYHSWSEKLSKKN